MQARPDHPADSQADKFHMILPKGSPNYKDLPGLSVLLGGLWVWGKTTAKVLHGVEVRKVRLSVELCTVYWHYLLLVWVVLFAVLLHRRLLLHGPPTGHL